MKQFTSFSVDINGDTSSFTIPTDDFNKFSEIAKKKNLRKTDMLVDAVKRLGFRSDIVTKIIQENAGLLAV